MYRSEMNRIAADGGPATKQEPVRGRRSDQRAGKERCRQVTRALNVACSCSGRMMTRSLTVATNNIT